MLAFFPRGCSGFNEIAKRFHLDRSCPRASLFYLESGNSRDAGIVIQFLGLEGRRVCDAPTAIRWTCENVWRRRWWRARAGDLRRDGLGSARRRP